MTDPYFAIRLIRRFGRHGASALSIMAMLAAGALLWQPAGWFALPVAAVIGVLIFLIAHSYVELVSLVFEKLN